MIVMALLISNPYHPCGHRRPKQKESTDSHSQCNCDWPAPGRVFASRRIPHFLGALAWEVPLFQSMCDVCSEEGQCKHQGLISCCSHAITSSRAVSFIRSSRT